MRGKCSNLDYAKQHLQMHRQVDMWTIMVDIAIIGLKFTFKCGPIWRTKIWMSIRIMMMYISIKTPKRFKVRVFALYWYPNYIIQAFGLTNNIKLHKEASNWLCINLALISSRIMFLDRLNLQSPLVLLCIVFRVKAHIRCIGVSSDRQNMQVMMSDPRYLWKGNSIFII